MNRISGKACCLLFVPSPSSGLHLRHQPCGSLHRHLHNGYKTRNIDKSQPLPLFGPTLWVLACKMSLSLAFSTALLTLGLVVFIILVIKRVLSTSSIDVRICALF